MLSNVIKDEPVEVGFTTFSDINNPGSCAAPLIVFPAFLKSTNGLVLILKPEAITLLLLIVHRSLLDVVFVASTKPGIFVGAPEEIEIILLLTDILSYPLLSLTIALAAVLLEDILLNWKPIMSTLSD